MAYKDVILQSAEEERCTIVEYYLVTYGAKEAAVAFLDEIDAKVSLICEAPSLLPLSRLGILADEGHHSVLLKHHVLLCTFDADTVYIEHIFHQSQDYAALI